MIARRRILYVLNAFQWDAPNSVIETIGRAMEAAGCEVQYVAWSRGGTMQASLSLRGSHTVVLGKGLFAGAFALASIIRHFRPNLVHANLARPTIGVCLARILAGKSNHTRWITSDHGTHEWHEKGTVRGALMDFLMPAILCTMDAVITVSESAASRLAQRGVPTTRMYVVQNGIEVCRFYPRPKVARQQLLAEWFPDDAQQSSVFLVGSAGNLRRLKGYDLLIHALVKVLEDFPQVRVVLWGEGLELEFLRKEASLASVDHAIRFCGYEASLEKRIALLDLYVQPSRVESFGMAAAEAMAVGVPVVVSDAGNLPELVNNGKAGMVFPAGDGAALAEAIMFLVQNREEREKLARAGRLRVLQRFTRQRMVSNMQCLYKRLVKEGDCPNDYI